MNCKNANICFIPHETYASLTHTHTRTKKLLVSQYLSQHPVSISPSAASPPSQQLAPSLSPSPIHHYSRYFHRKSSQDLRQTVYAFIPHKRATNEGQSFNISFAFIPSMKNNQKTFTFVILSVTQLCFISNPLSPLQAC